MNARITPLMIEPRGIGRLTPERVQELDRNGKTVRIVSRAKRSPAGVKARVRAEVVSRIPISSPPFRVLPTWFCSTPT